MDQNEFIKTYFNLLAEHLIKHGYDGNELIKAVMTGTFAMINNDSGKSNEDIFWETFSSLVDTDEKLVKTFEKFYEEVFDQVEKVTSKDEDVVKIIKILKEKGYTLALATNPLFPQIATFKRIRWAGLNPNDFKLVTTYENSYHCKPNLKYYQDILETLNKKPDECLMIGNDIGEDMIINKLGVKSFLLTNFLINNVNENVDNYQNGDYKKLLELVNEFENLNEGA
jgi:FMN phosphatase YigB (HAD superfamily)